MPAGTWQRRDIRPAARRRPHAGGWRAASDEPCPLVSPPLRSGSLGGPMARSEPISSVAVDAAETAPRQFGDAAADDFGIEVEAVGHPVPAGALGQPDQPVGQRAAMLLVD